MVWPGLEFIANEEVVAAAAAADDADEMNEVQGMMIDDGRFNNVLLPNGSLTLSLNS